MFANLIAKLSKVAHYFLCSVLLMAMHTLLHVSQSHSQNWVTVKNASSKGQLAAEYIWPNRPIVFVGGEILSDPNNANKGKFETGLDVVAVVNQSKGSKIYYLNDTTGAIELLFPIAGAHETLIDAPIGDGAVSDSPSIGSDGRTLWFAWSHKNNSDDSDYFSIYGADLYSVDLTPKLNNPNLNLNQLTIKRLTPFTPNKHDHAMNPYLASFAEREPNRGNYFVGPVEMTTEQGKVLVYGWDGRRLQNSNDQRQYHNRNINLFTSEIYPDGNLGPPNQFQYYTTTSAFSPFRLLRGGVGFTYQGTTTDSRHWEQQLSDSNGKWYPGLGYGRNPLAAHLGTACMKNIGVDQGENIVSTIYYQANNNGYGGLVRLPISMLGQNDLKISNSFKVTGQFGDVQITSNVTVADNPSGKASNGKYYGKFSSPACAEPDVIYFSHTPTSANGRLDDDEGKRFWFRPYIGGAGPINGQSGLDPFDPVLDIGKHFFKIVDGAVLPDANGKIYWAAFPVPVITWSERTGDTASEQPFQPTIVAPNTGITPGMPYAIVGTSNLQNTDRVPMDCLYGNKPWNPNSNWSSQEANIRATAFLRALVAPYSQTDFCADGARGGKEWGSQGIDPVNILGLQISLTSNEATDYKGTVAQSFGTDSSGARQELETKRLLGIIDTRGRTTNLPGTNMLDTSVKALIPANAPFEFSLLDSLTGMSFTNVNSWHALKPGEQRADCGGCHQHSHDGKGYAFTGSIADQSPAIDLVNTIQYLDYDAFCTPIVKTTTDPVARKIPDFTDVYAGMDQHCGSCHNSLRSSNTLAKAALSYSDEASAIAELNNNGYLGLGDGAALESMAFWAARGMRTDRRDNNIASYAPSHASGNHGFKHSPHPNLCDGSNLAAAQWVYKFGYWLDNHSIRSIKAGYGAHFDRFHPVVDGALTDRTNCLPTELLIGFWDETGSVAELQILQNGARIDNNQYQNLPNGSIKIPLSGMSSSDTIEVIAIDAAQNRQLYSKTIDKLALECTAAPDTSPEFTPTPTPTPTPTEEPAPAPPTPEPPTPTPPSSGSPSVDPVPPNPGLGEIILSLNNKVKPGRLVEVTIDGGALRAGMPFKLQFYGVVNKKRRDILATRSQTAKAVNKLSGFLGADGKASLSFVVPIRIYSNFAGKTISLQALLENTGIVEFSKSISFALPKNRISNTLLPSTKLQRKLEQFRVATKSDKEKIVNLKKRKRIFEKAEHIGAVLFK